MKPRCELEKFSTAFTASEVEGGNNSCVPRGRLISSAFTTSDVEGGNNSCVPRGRSISVSAETGREDSSALGGFPHRFLLSGRQLVHLVREAAHSQRTQEPLPLHWQHLRRPTRLEMRSLSNLDCSIASSTWGSRRGFSSIPQKTTCIFSQNIQNPVDDDFFSNGSLHKSPFQRLCFFIGRTSGTFLCMTKTGKERIQNLCFPSRSIRYGFLNNPGWSPRPGGLYHLVTVSPFFIFAEEAQYNLAQNVQT